MSRLANLLDELCPQGVEYRPLGEVGTFIRGGGPQKKDFLSEGLPCIHYGQIYTHYGLFTTSTISYVSQEVFDKSRKAQPGNVIIAVTSENDEDLGDAVAWLGSQPAAVSNHTLIYDTEMDPQYVSYFLRSEHLQKQKRRVTTGTKVRSISEKGFSSLVIPVPPLEVQQEIVRVLDAFTDLEQSLAAELELRKKQFEEYRRTLLDNPEGAECRQLGEIVQIQNGKDWKTQEPGEIPVYGSGGRMQQMVAIPSTEGPSVLLPRKGSLEVQYVEDPIWNVDTVFTTVCNAEVLNTRYFYFAMKSVDLGRVSTSATRPSLTQSALKKLTIPVPNLTMQQDIVEKLDAFDLLIQSLEQEIALRRKQYEFYRDELLRFTPKGA